MLMPIKLYAWQSEMKSFMEQSASSGSFITVTELRLLSKFHRPPPSPPPHPHPLPTVLFLWPPLFKLRMFLRYKRFHLVSKDEPGPQESRRLCVKMHYHFFF